MAFAARSFSPARLFRPNMSISTGLHSQRNVSFSSYLVTPKQLNEALKKNPPQQKSQLPRA
ncbi:hypothetical protein N7497_009182 [Penicillium chrysogenum]|nr:hypothetical protein N7497_009182 [Penicillium chrysogenum]